MRFFIFAVMLLLTACATKVNYYTPAVQSWRGGNQAALIQQWGQPDTKVIAPNGSTLYIYRTTTYRTYMNQPSPEVGVHFAPGGKPVLITTPPTSGSRNNLYLTCTTAFEVNRNGKIVDTHVSGQGCTSGSQFAEARKNPG